MQTCPYCGSGDVDYDGYDDGGGDYGDSVCEQFSCIECGQDFEGDCLEAADDEIDLDSPVPYTLPPKIGEFDDIPF